jgi:hypothetical protein
MICGLVATIATGSRSVSTSNCTACIAGASTIGPLWPMKTV